MEGLCEENYVKDIAWLYTQSTHFCIKVSIQDEWR